MEIKTWHLPLIDKNYLCWTYTHPYSVISSPGELSSRKIFIIFNFTQATLFILDDLTGWVVKLWGYKGLFLTMLIIKKWHNLPNLVPRVCFLSFHWSKRVRDPGWGWSHVSTSNQSLQEGSLNNQVLSLTFCQSQNKACFSHQVSKKPSPHNYWHINLEWKHAKCWGCFFRERSCYVSANRILKINYFPPFIKAPPWQTKSPIFMEIITCFCHQSSHSYCIAFEHVGQWSSKEKDQRKC